MEGELLRQLEFTQLAWTAGPILLFVVVVFWICNGKHVFIVLVFH
jgi:hypothetical protein